MSLGKAKQISVQSSPECDAALNALAWDMDESGVRYMGGKVSRQAVVNGLLVWLASLEPRRRREILGEALRRLEDLVLKRQPDEAEAGDDHRAALVDAYLASLSPEAPPRRGEGGLGEDRTLGAINVPIYGRKGKTDPGPPPDAQVRRIGRGKK